MQLAGTTLRNHKFFSFTFLLFLFVASSLKAQDNSPYSRYGLGNLYPQSNIINRGMGGVSAAYSDVMSVNYSNPASYAGFQVFTEQRSGKVAQARVILDAGVNINSNMVIGNTVALTSGKLTLGNFNLTAQSVTGGINLQALYICH
jgi:hypothetical protein